MNRNKIKKLLNLNLKADWILIVLTLIFIVFHITIIFVSVNFNLLKVFWIGYIFISYLVHLLKEKNLKSLKKLYQAQYNELVFLLAPLFAQQ